MSHIAPIEMSHFSPHDCTHIFSYYNLTILATQINYRAVRHQFLTFVTIVATQHVSHVMSATITRPVLSDFV